LKYASWLLTLLLGALLLFSLDHLPPQGHSSILVDHVSSRYAERGEAETGIHSPLVALMADYRSFDLLALSILFTVSALGVLLVTGGTAKSFPVFPGLFWLGFGMFLTLGVGFIGLKEGSNFLDYEALALWTDPHRARANGALLLIGGTLLCLGGLLSLFIRRFRSPEGAK